MSLRNVILILLTVLVVVSVANSVYTVQQTERAILLRFGAVSHADVEPGFHWKLPFIEDIKIFDARVLTLDSSPETYYTIGKKPLLVDSFAKWRVEDVQKYYTASSGDQRRAEQVLQERLNEGLRNQIGSRDMHEVISGERDQLMEDLKLDLNKVLLTNLGIKVIDVRVKRVDFPPEVSQRVYERMNSEREIQARQHRAQGEELAIGIRADAERQTTVIEANAYKQSEELRGDGDSRAAAIYAQAYKKDPEFYEFYRSINAYRNVFRNKNDLLIIDPKSKFFKYLNDPG